MRIQIIYTEMRFILATKLSQGLLNQNSVYINGARADPPAKTISMPKSRRIIINGNSQNFFLVLRKVQRSFKNSVICIRFFSCNQNIFFKSNESYI